MLSDSNQKLTDDGMRAEPAAPQFHSSIAQDK